MDYMKLLELSGNTQMIADIEASERELDLLEKMYQGRHGLGIDTETMSIEEIQKRMDAASRALGLANRISDPEYKKKHLSRIMSNMNTIRAAIAKMVQEDDAAASAANEPPAGRSRYDLSSR